MINETYRAMLGKKSVIRELSELATRMVSESDPAHPLEIFDYSLGNPSVPVPPEVNTRAVWYLSHGIPAKVHGYSPTLGIPQVKERLAASLARWARIDFSRITFATCGCCSRKISSCVLSTFSTAPFASEFPSFCFV